MDKLVLDGDFQCIDQNYNWYKVCLSLLPKR